MRFSYLAILLSFSCLMFNSCEQDRNFSPDELAVLNEAPFPTAVVKQRLAAIEVDNAAFSILDQEATEDLKSKVVYNDATTSYFKDRAARNIVPEWDILVSLRGIAYLPMISQESNNITELVRFERGYLQIVTTDIETYNGSWSNEDIRDLYDHQLVGLLLRSVFIEDATVISASVNRKGNSSEKGCGWQQSEITVTIGNTSHTFFTMPTWVCDDEPGGGGGGGGGGGTGTPADADACQAAGCIYDFSSGDCNCIFVEVECPAGCTYNYDSGQCEC